MTNEMIDPAIRHRFSHFIRATSARIELQARLRQIGHWYLGLTSWLAALGASFMTHPIRHSNVPPRRIHFPALRRWWRRFLKAIPYILGGIAIPLFVVAIIDVGRIDQLHNEVEQLKIEMSDATDRLSQLDHRVDNIRSADATHPTDAGDKRSKVVHTANPIQLDAKATALIRGHIKLVPSPPGTRPTIRVGDVVPSNRLMAIPKAILDNVPALANDLFTVDKNNAIVIVSPVANRALLIIPPK